MNVSTRPVAADDKPFLYSLFASWKAEELMLHLLPPEMRQPLLDMQWQAHRIGMTRDYPNAESAIIEAGGQPAGTLTVERTPEAHYLREIALLPQWRGQGLGRRVVTAQITEAAQAGCPLVLHVSRGNTVAQRLYLSLGFTPEDDGGGKLPMVWRPTPP